MFGIGRGATRTARRRLPGSTELMRVPGDSPFRRLHLWRRARGALVARIFPVLFAAGLALLAQHLFLGNAFQIQRVEVVGARLVDPAEIRAAVALEQTTNLFLANRGRARAAVLAIRPIQRVDVAFVWPDTVRLTIVERRPAYIWKVDPTRYLVSEDGIVLAPTDQENQPVILVDVDRRPVRVGDQVDVKALAAARYLRNVLPSAVGITPHYFEYSHTLGVVLPTERGYRVAFGFGDDLPTKVVTFRAVAETLAQQQARSRWSICASRNGPITAEKVGLPPAQC